MSEESFFNAKWAIRSVHVYHVENNLRNFGITTKIVSTNSGHGEVYSFNFK